LTFFGLQVKTSVQQLIETWDENNPQDLAEKIALRLTKNEPVKFGAGVTLLRRATRPLHFRVASQVRNSLLKANAENVH
jgi:hypothetical protein